VVCYQQGGTPLFLKVDPHSTPARGVMRDMGLKSGQDQILVYLAGMAMDRQMGVHLSRGNYRSDRWNVWKIANDIHPRDRSAAVRMVNAAEKQIDRQVRNVAPAIMALGAELYKHGRLGAEQIDDVLHGRVMRLKSSRALMAMDQLPRDPQSCKERESEMPMQPMEDPNKVRATTNQPRGPTQQASFGRDLGPIDAELPEEMKHHPGQAFGIRGPAGAEPGTHAPSTRLQTSVNNNGNGKFISLIELLDALEAAGENGQELDEDEECGNVPPPIAGQGGPESTGTIHDADPLIRSPGQGLPMRESARQPSPVKMPGQDHSCAVGDARRMQEQRRAPEQRLDRHLRKSGMRSAAHRDYAVGLGRKQIAHDAAMAEDSVGGDLDDFLKFCPGAGKIESLSPPVRSTTPNNRRIGQDAAVTWTWQFNPMTNALEQVPVSRKR
jgi:hypothetical protein